MRMRPKKNREPRLRLVEDMLALSKDGFIDIENSFNRKRPLWLEIGCGKGAFAAAMSARHAEVNYLALEKSADALLMAMEKAVADGACERGNLKFWRGDAESLNVLLGNEKVSGLFINFCDPWPKARNAKRRLTSPLFLEKYKTILDKDARIYFKTDNRPLFDYSIEQFALCGYKTENVCFDLHGSALNENNIETEYEKTFFEKGFKINYLEAFIS